MTVHAQRGQEEIVLAPRAMTNSATHSAIFDTFGASYATVRVLLSSEINTNAIGPTLSLLSSDVDAATSYVTVIADRTAENIVAAKSVTYHVDKRSNGRYLKLQIDSETTTNDDVTVSASGTLTRLSEEPAGASDMGNSTNEVVVIV